VSPAFLKLGIILTQFLHINPEPLTHTTPIMTNNKPQTIDEYINGAPEVAREKLIELRAILKKTAPKATEAIKWGYPVFEEGRILFSFSAHKSHINFMPTHSSLAPFKKELQDFKTGKDTMQLPYDKPLPKLLIKKIAKHRLEDVRDNDSKWMKSK
jgi:uncharacterized protein YdhG (YjbR/CyaY superfamily)